MRSIISAFVGLAFCFVSASVAAAEDDEPHVTAQSLVERMASPLGIAGSTAKPMPPLALDLVKDFEQWRDQVYNDAAGYCTIGYGHLIALQRCEVLQLGDFADGITTDEGHALLDNDTLFARLTVEDMVSVPLTEEQYGALSSFIFNVGATRFGRSTLLSVLNEGDYESAASEFGRWRKAGGRVLRGLVHRRACETALFEGRLHYDANGRFNRASCATLGIAESSGDPIDIEVGEE
jgi:lysozyme